MEQRSKNQETFIKMQKKKRSKPKPYVWDGRDDYWLLIASHGSLLDQALAGTWADIKKCANQKARALQKRGYKDLEVIWQQFPDGMEDTIMSYFFTWEG